MIPQELKDLPQWVVWRSEERKGKITKVPYYAAVGETVGRLQHASTTSAITWMTYEHACLTRRQFNATGIGFVFTAGDPYCGIDFDYCVTLDEDGTDVVSPEALTWIHKFDTYTELSPSRTGVHLICRAELPNGKGRKFKHRGVGVEIYDRGRFFTVTEDDYIGGMTDNVPRNCQKEVDELLALLNPPQPPPKSKQETPPGEYTRWQDVNVQVHPEAEPPGGKLMALSNDPHFKATFEHTRQTDEGSPSSYDMAIARMAATAGWTDQEIVDLIIMHRRHYGYDKTDRLDYYQRTIFNLRTDEKYQQALSQLDDLAMDAEQSDGSTPPDDSTRAAVLEVIKKLTTLDIKQFVQYGRDPASYTIVLKNNSRISIQKSADVREQRVWQDIAQEHRGVAFFKLKATKWQQFLRCLSLIREFEINPDGGLAEEVRDALYTYMKFAETQTMDAVENGLFFRHEQYYYFTKSGFVAWLSQTHQDIPRTGIMAHLKNAGAKPYKVVVERPDGTWLRKNYWQIVFNDSE